MKDASFYINAEFNRKVRVFDDYMKLSDRQEACKRTACYLVVRYAELQGLTNEVPAHVWDYYYTIYPDLDITKTHPKLIGRQVGYKAHPAAAVETGVITSYNSTFIFVDYQNVGRGQATPPEKLKFV